ncbi:SGNH/GDSL hydrolase family protein [Thiolinea disciformis]|uniref:SGNH/GDSL hydrolase family protein n=1 Tax=Thiolinea disciformis TaxID=125614 RepID=UPI0003658048|nr:SGNH/GDSL hydrolase family protein [Thiolinea disciformis]
MKWLFSAILLGSLAANATLFYLTKKFYQEAQTVRLNPLELERYPSALADKKIGQKRVVFFGDSRALGWPAPAAQGLEFINRGIGDQTSTQVRYRVAAHLAPLKPDLVLLQLCVNDLKVIAQMPEQQAAIVQRCKENVTKIVQEVRASGSEVLLTTVFPVNKASWQYWIRWSEAVDVALQDVNHYIKSLAGEGVYVLDAYDVLEGEPNQTHPQFSRDLLHLNEVGYAQLNQALSEWLKAYLAESAE